MISAIAYAREHGSRFVDELKDLLRIPSISTMPAHAGDVERAAAWLAEHMRRIGMHRVELSQAPGFLPLVYGEWLGAGPDAPTVLVYSHFDVQPAAMDDGWQTPPFEPVERDGKLYARGTIDSKMHVMAHLKAIEALIATGGAPVNIKVIFEGEEESGSEHIVRYVHDHRAAMAVDVIAVSDGSLPDPDQPLIVYGLRGIVTMELEVTGPVKDLHSGQFGGTVHNPIQALAEILAQLHDAEGRVTVPGFYDRVRPLSDEERAALADVGPSVAAMWEQVAAAPQPWGEPGYAIHERIAVRPTLEINGITGGYAAEGFKTVLPARALAKISCRLVPDQEPDAIFELVEAHIRSLTPPTVRSMLRRMEMGSRAAVLDRHAPAVAAVASAYERGWGRRPIYNREGGSIPVVAAFQEALEAPVIMLPFGHKGGYPHGPNEHMIIDMFHKGIATTIIFYDELAKLTGATPQQT